MRDVLPDIDRWCEHFNINNKLQRNINPQWFQLDLREHHQQWEFYIQGNGIGDIESHQSLWLNSDLQQWRRDNNYSVHMDI